jgi:branched-chain amino acid transport system ATP-binding protein
MMAGDVIHGRLGVRDVSVQYGAVRAVAGVTAAFRPGEFSGVMGPNGAGKTTLLNAISGFTAMSAGQLELDGQDITRLDARARAEMGIVRGFQTVRLLERESVFDNVLVGCERLPQPPVIAQLFNLPSQARSRRRDVAAVIRTLGQLGLLAEAGRLASELPFAGRRLVEIARLLVVRPEVLLLDEPAAGLDLAERRQLVETVRAYHGADPFTLIVIEHDVDLVAKLCTDCVALAEGRVIARGTPAEVLSAHQVKAAYFGQAAHA